MKKFEKNTIFICILILFPGYFLYHYLLGQNFIYPYLGGYFTIACLFILPVLIILYLANARLSFTKIELLFFFIILLMITISSYNYLIDKPENFKNEMLKWSLSAVLYNIILYLIGKNMDINKSFVKILLFITFIISILVIQNIDLKYGRFYLDTDYVAFPELLSTYQGFARSILVVFSILIIYYFTNDYFILIFLLSIILLFTIGSRTEFVLYLITVILLKLISNPKKIIKTLIGFLLLVSLLFFIFYKYLPSNRTFQLFNIKQASSFIRRNEFMQFAIQLILKNPILNNYGAYTILGGIGCYPHNILSAWVNLGIIGFFSYILLFIKMWKYFVKNIYLIKNKNYNFKLFAFFLFYTTFALLTSKDYSLMFVGYTVGLYSNVKSSLVLERKASLYMVN
jgi:O-antigen ligase